MSLKILKLNKKNDLVEAVKQIKSLKDDGVVFELESGSAILRNQNHLRLLKKTGEIYCKEVKIQTSDEAGMQLVKKVGMLPGEVTSVKAVRPTRRTNASPKPGTQFGDITMSKKVHEEPQHHVVHQSYEPSGSRLEFEIAKKSSKFSKFFILILVVVIVAVFGALVLLPKANVKVTARSEAISRDFEVSVDKENKAVNASALSIPGVVVSKEVSLTKTFDTTGTKSSGTKATGTVTIVNNTPNTLTLKAATTTLIANGKKFNFVSDVGGIRGNGASTTGIQIIAQDGGADSNLAANTRFQISNAALGNADVYATNPQALTGGTTGAVTKILTQEDIDKATDAMLVEIVSVAAAEISQTNSVEMKLLDSGSKKEVLAKTANKNIGAEVTSFDMTIIARVSGLAFREDDVSEVVLAKINEVLSDDKYLLESAESKYEAVYKTIDPAQTKGVLSVHFETVAAYKMDTDNLSKLLTGKNELEIKEILLSKPEVDDVEVKFWPEWFVHKAPRFNGKINIETVLKQ